MKQSGSWKRRRASVCADKIRQNRVKSLSLLKEAPFPQLKALVETGTMPTYLDYLCLSQRVIWRKVFRTERFCQCELIVKNPLWKGRVNHSRFARMFGNFYNFLTSSDFQGGFNGCTHPSTPYPSDFNKQSVNGEIYLQENDKKMKRFTLRQLKCGDTTERDEPFVASCLIIFYLFAFFFYCCCWLPDETKHHNNL